jgi:signal transduction histidine kinase
MGKDSYDALIEHIQQLERAAKEHAATERQLRHELRQAETQASKRELHLRALQAFSQGTLGVIQEEHVYQLLCQTVVHQLKWDGAVVVSLRPTLTVKGSFHLTQRQLKGIGSSLEHIPGFLKSYAHHDVVMTMGHNTAEALALRTVFQTDDVVGAPIRFGDEIYGYLLACAHTVRNTHRTLEDARFLVALANLAAHAAELGQSLADLESQNQRLRGLDELKDSFISITSHQLRTPLSIVKWIMSVLDTDPAVQALPEQHKLITQAYVSNERLIHVVNDLLNVSRIQEGKLPYSPQPCDIRVLLHDLLPGMEKLVEQASVSIIASLDGEVGLVDVDPILVKEALQNILDNALDYNITGGTIRVTVQQVGSEVQVVIANTGPGVAEADRGAIFDQFYRSPEALTMHPNGNGLGLFLARAILRQHRGDVQLVSEPDKLTTVTVSLPVHV